MARPRPNPLPPIDRLSAVLSYDVETGAICRCGSSMPAGCVKRTGYRYVGILGGAFAAHRLAWALFHGADPSGEIDHINGDKDDNRIANLRLADRSQNNRNSRRARGKQYPKGVWREKDSGRFRAQIRHSGRQHYLGAFDSPEEAHAAYRDAAEKFHGEFARFD
jgi:hypothetical protein